MKKPHHKKPLSNANKSPHQNIALSIFSLALEPHIVVTCRKLVWFDCFSWRLFLARLWLGFWFGFGFCAWIYGFVWLAPLFETTQGMLAQICATFVMSVLLLLALSVWLLIPKALKGYFGFFAGLFLFYWVGLSFRYSAFPFLIPFVWLGVGFVYAVLFYVALFFTARIYRILSLLVLGVIAPFGFDWFVPQAFFAYSIFGVTVWQFLALLCGIALLLPSSNTSKQRIVFGVVMLCVGIDFGTKYAPPDPFLEDQIALVQSNIPQDLKWQENTLQYTIESVFDTIDSAIAHSKQMIIFPETILPFILNSENPLEQSVQQKLLTLSKDIVIVLGAFSEQNLAFHNSTYIFANAKMQILNKVILAPFGERIPLPDFLAKPLYKVFFGLEEGLASANVPQNFTALGRLWRNAICYEGTSRKLYTSAPPYLVMISNNGWFHPSIEPYLQRVLLKYYARLYGTTILHAVNRSDSGIIAPLLFGDKIEGFMLATH